MNSLFDAVSWLWWNMWTPAGWRNVVAMARRLDFLLFDNHLSAVVVMMVITILDHLHLDFGADVFDAFDTIVITSTSWLR